MGEVMSTLCFVVGCIICLGMLLKFLVEEMLIRRAQLSKLGDGSAAALPTLIGRSSSNVGKSPSADDSAKVVTASVSGGTFSRESNDEKIREIYSTLSALSTCHRGESGELYDVVKQLGDELPTA